MAGGVLLAAQARVNGGLATRLGSAVVTALVSFAVGTAALAIVWTVRRRPVRLAGPVRWWWCLGGLGGALLVSTSAAVVPVIGVALLGVCVVAGQTSGGLLVDRLGLSPRGHQPLSARRLAGAALAVGAMALAATGAAGDVHTGLVALIVAAGVAVALQQAANGNLQRVSGDPFFAALVSFSVGTAALALVVAGHHPAVLRWPDNPGLYVGGLGGAAYITLSAAVVGRLGVLRLTLASVAGQLLGALVLDAAVPSGRRLGPGTLLATALTLVAVAVASSRSSGGISD